jgi:hypothetical protein
VPFFLDSPADECDGAPAPGTLERASILARVGRDAFHDMERLGWRQLMRSGSRLGAALERILRSWVRFLRAAAQTKIAASSSILILSWSRYRVGGPSLSKYHTVLYPWDTRRQHYLL